MMAAQFERDDAPDHQTSSQQHLPGRSRIAYTQAPLFVNRHNPPAEPESIWAAHNRRRRAKRAAMEEYLERKAASAESSPTEEMPPQTFETSNNWAHPPVNAPQERRFGLGDAWQMTENRPQSSQGIVGEDARIRSPLPESRIPRSKHFSPETKRNSSPRRGLVDAYRRAEREEIPQGFGSSDSESTGQRQGSPSPAGRNRRPEYQSDGSVNSAGEPITVHPYYRRKKLSREDVMGDRPLPMDEESVRNRANAARRTATFRRMATSTTPLFFGRHGSSAGLGRVAQTAMTLESKASPPHQPETIIAQPARNEGDIIEPPMINYRTWGQKAKQRPGWVQRIVSPESSLEIKGLPPTASEEELKLAADTPLPSVEIGSEPTPPSSRPGSAQPVNASPEKSKIWDAELDFTAQSLQMSPQLRIRPTKIDQLREREIQNLTARAVATNRLEEIRERNSEERSVLSETSRTSMREPTPEPTKPPAEDEPYHERTILEEEGERIAGTPITVFSAGSYRPSSSSQDRGSRDGEGSSRRPGHKRDDSFEVLRRLSRAASSSPAPPRSQDMGENDFKHKDTVQENEGEAQIEKQPGDADKKSTEKPPEMADEKPKVNGLEIESKRHSRSSSRPRSEADPEERIAAEAKLFDLPDNKSERNSIRAPSPSPPSSDDEKFDETPRPKKKDPLSLPTPRVMGAFIETPAPTIKKQRKSRTFSPYYPVGGDIEDGVSSSDSNQNDPETESQATDKRPSRGSSSIEQTQKPKQVTRPPLINTAPPIKASDDLRRIKAEAQIEDSTLDDFDGLLDAVVKRDVDTTMPLDPLLNLEYDDKGNPLSEKERERRLESIILDRMNQHLKNTSSSIRDARQGIERLEHQVSSAATAQPAAKPDDEQMYLKIPVPRLWVKDPEATRKGRFAGLFQKNWKFTWLGFILSSFLAWFIAESTVCEIYCHPTTSSIGNWHYTDPFFPWAIPTKLDQWTGTIVSSSASSVWESIDIALWGPQMGRKRWISTPRSYGASDWWVGRDAPAYMDTPIESGSETGNSFFDDEVI